MAHSLSPTEIYLVKRLKVMPPSGYGRATQNVVATAAHNLQALGFGLSAPLLERLSHVADAEVVQWYESVLPILQKMVGAHRAFEPMYPNFPRQVMEASAGELLFNAMTHYYGFVLSDQLGDPNLVMLPRYEKEARPILEGFHELRWIELGSAEDFDAIFTSRASSNGSLSESDKEVLRWFAETANIEQLLPDRIPQKETLAFLVSALPNPECLAHGIKTATDVLRIAVAMSEGDVSLAEPTKFRNFSKRERRFLLNCLEQSGESRTEDMLRWRARWIRLGERLHPGDFKKRYPKTLVSFDTLRNNKPFKTFHSKVEESIGSGDADKTLELLSQRPGDFARRLDHVLRTQTNQQQTLGAFFHVAENVSTPVLFQAWRHFEQRDLIHSRAFFPKGNAAKVQFQEGALPDLQQGVAQAAADGLRQVLRARFSNLPPLGKVFIDERLQDQVVPFSQRSASRSLRSIARGSSFDLPTGDTVRFFCWWKNMAPGGGFPCRVDLDLSASLFNMHWESQGDIAYYNLKQGQCYHSGDITSAPQGACEFVDVSLKSVLAMNARFVVMSVCSYTGQPFLTLPECFGGWMMREHANSGEIFEPKTVQNKVDITAASRVCTPVIIDAQERRVFWADLELRSASQLTNAAKNLVGLSQIGRAIVEMNKPTLFDLFTMHADARGERTSNREQAETVFGLHEGDVCAFDTDIILSQFLA